MNIKSFVITLAFFFAVMCAALGLKAQGYEIKVNVKSAAYDSLTLQKVDTGGKFVDVQKIARSKNSVFKANKFLMPGMYFVKGDSVVLTEIFISEERNQSMQVTIDGDNVTFAHSAENAANQLYIAKILEFENRMRQLDNEFNQMKKDNLPPYMMQPFIDSLMARAMRIETEKKEYQNSVIEQYRGTLFASVVKSSMELPQPPQEVYGSQHLMQLYMADHLFDNYEWSDARLNNTPISVNKRKQFANLLYYLDSQEGAPYLQKVLTNARVNEKAYFALFDHLEKVLGATKSPYRVEGLYIVMLKDAIAYDKTSNVRKVRYEAELKHLDKNLDGTVVPNFNILMSNGDTTTLYDVESPYMLLYFHNPECPTCREARNRMKDYPILNQAIENGKITVMTIYFEKDKHMFDNFLKKEANPNWKHGWNYDNQIEKEELFYLITIPYMFLVDKDKRVIKKDILINEIEDYVKRLK